MITVTCDRCGKFINKFHMDMNNIFPGISSKTLTEAKNGTRYMLSKGNDDGDFVSLVLCNICQNDLDDFMTNNPNGYFHK